MDAAEHRVCPARRPTIGSCQQPALNHRESVHIGGCARPEPRQHSQSVLGMLIEPCRASPTVQPQDRHIAKKHMVDRAAADAVPVERTEAGDAAWQPSWSSSSSCGLAAPAILLGLRSWERRLPRTANSHRELPAEGDLRRVTLDGDRSRFGDVPPRSGIKSSDTVIPHTSPFAGMADRHPRAGCRQRRAIGVPSFFSSLIRAFAAGQLLLR